MALAEREVADVGYIVHIIFIFEKRLDNHKIYRKKNICTAQISAKILRYFCLKNGVSKNTTKTNAGTFIGIGCQADLY